MKRGLHVTLNEIARRISKERDAQRHDERNCTVENRRKMRSLVDSSDMTIDEVVSKDHAAYCK